MEKTMAKRRKKIDSARRIVIETRMRKLGIGINSLACAIGVSHTLVVLVIDGRYPSSRKYEEKIAQSLGADTEVLFANVASAKRDELAS